MTFFSISLFCVLVVDNKKGTTDVLAAKPCLGVCPLAISNTRSRNVFYARISLILFSLFVVYACIINSPSVAGPLSSIVLLIDSAGRRRHLATNLPEKNDDIRLLLSRHR